MQMLCYCFAERRTVSSSMSCSRTTCVQSSLQRWLCRTETDGQMVRYLGRPAWRGFSGKHSVFEDHRDQSPMQLVCCCTLGRPAVCAALSARSVHYKNRCSSVEASC